MLAELLRLVTEPEEGEHAKVFIHSCITTGRYGSESSFLLLLLLLLLRTCDLQRIIGQHPESFFPIVRLLSSDTPWFQEKGCAFLAALSSYDICAFAIVEAGGRKALIEVFGADYASEGKHFCPHLHTLALVTEWGALEELAGFADMALRNLWAHEKQAEESGMSEQAKQMAIQMASLHDELQESRVRAGDPTHPALWPCPAYLLKYLEGMENKALVEELQRLRSVNHELQAVLAEEKVSLSLSHNLHLMFVCFCCCLACSHGFGRTK